MDEYSRTGVGGMSGDGPGVLEGRQVLSLFASCLHKVANIVLNSRQTLVPLEKMMLNRVCNMITEEYDNIRKNLQAWADVSIPLCITVSLTNPQLCPSIAVFGPNTPYSSEIVLEKWYFSCFTPREQKSLKRDDQHSRNKKLILFVRTFVNLVRLLPAHKIFQFLLKDEKKLSQMRFTVEKVDKIPRNWQESGMHIGTIESFPVAPVDSIFGIMQAVVYYRTDCYKKSFNRKSGSSAPMNIINDYNPDDSRTGSSMAVSKPRSITNQKPGNIQQRQNTHRTSIVGSYESENTLPPRDRSHSLPSSALNRPSAIGLSTSFRNTPPSGSASPFVYSDAQPVPVPYASSPFGAISGTSQHMIEDASSPPFSSSLPQSALRHMIDPMAPDIPGPFAHTPPFSYNIPASLIDQLGSSAGSGSRSLYLNKFGSITSADSRAAKLNVAPFRKDATEGMPRTGSSGSLYKQDEQFGATRSSPSSLDNPIFALNTADESDNGLGRFVRECQTAVPLRLFQNPEKILKSSISDELHRFKRLQTELLDLAPTKKPELDAGANKELRNEQTTGTGYSLNENRLNADTNASRNLGDFRSGEGLSFRPALFSGLPQFGGEETPFGEPYQRKQSQLGEEDEDAPFA